MAAHRYMTQSMFLRISHNWAAIASPILIKLGLQLQDQLFMFCLNFYLPFFNVQID